MRCICLLPKAGTGNYFPTLREETAKYVKPCAQELIQWLSSLRNDGKQVFLLTNSFIDYTSLLMDFAVGLVTNVYFPVLFLFQIC